MQHCVDLFWINNCCK